MWTSGNLLPPIQSRTSSPEPEVSTQCSSTIADSPRHINNMKLLTCRVKYLPDVHGAGSKGQSGGVPATMGRVSESRMGSDDMNGRFLRSSPPHRDSAHKCTCTSEVFQCIPCPSHLHNRRTESPFRHGYLRIFWLLGLCKPR